MFCLAIGHLGGGVLGAGGDHVVVERGPVHLQTGRLVGVHEGNVLVDAARLVDGKDQEGAAGALVDNGLEQKVKDPNMSEGSRGRT